MLKQSLQDALLTALKEKNTRTVSTLRFLNAALKNKEIEKRAELDDNEVIQIIRKQVKELVDAKALFEKGGRTDLVVENQEQVKILQAFLPEEISDDELKKEIEALIAKNSDVYQKTPKAIIAICINALKSKASPQRIMETLQQYSS